MKTVSQRLYIVAAVIAVGSSCIWLMPQAGDIKPSRLARHLPIEFDDFRGQRVQISGEELRVLAKDTEFERIQYINTLDSGLPPVEVSVVFSGKDVNNSIHRPERCLRSQGWNFSRQRKVVIERALPGGEDLHVREIVCEKVAQMHDGREIRVQRIQYYTFLGHTAITEDHYQRTFQDMKDRVFKGYDQRWAYATFSMPVTAVYAEQGLIAKDRALDLDETAVILETFIRKLAPLVIDADTEQ